jgi:hypothetical protein
LLTVHFCGSDSTHSLLKLLKDRDATQLLYSTKPSLGLVLGKSILVDLIPHLHWPQC